MDSSRSIESQKEKLEICKEESTDSSGPEVKKVLSVTEYKKQITCNNFDLNKGIDSYF